MVIELGLISDLPEIDRIMVACRESMISRGIYQWNEFYPNQNVYIRDIQRKELWVLKSNSKIIGVVACSSLKDKEYKDIEWIISDSSHYYVHRLMVDPVVQKKGYGRKLMHFIEDMAIKNGVASIRLDTFSQNKSNQKFYQDLGYVQLPYDVYYPQQSDDPCHCFERILTHP
ncbi:MAG: GNAT family N-acetyltransferase [Flavobacteriaceae bacterium]|nr:GNAT family N-acetyltransferase [Flavobacteriaceae bacterium]